MKNKIKNKQGFTLLELLVVVVIIGILAAIALPQYQEAVEKSIMQEAIVNLKAIAESNERFYMINNKYATYYEINKLDIEIPGEIKEYANLSGNRLGTKYFIYAPTAPSSSYKALATRLKEGIDSYVAEGYYRLNITQGGILNCQTYGGATKVQKKLCAKISRDGHL